MHRDDYPSNVQHSSPAADLWTCRTEAQRGVLADVSVTEETQRPIDARGLARQEERAFIHALFQALDRMRCLAWEARLVATEQQRLVEGLCQIAQEYELLLQREDTTPRDDTGEDSRMGRDGVSSV